MLPLVLELLCASHCTISSDVLFITCSYFVSTILNRGNISVLETLSQEESYSSEVTGLNVIGSV